MCGGSCFHKLEDRRTVINLGFINNYNVYSSKLLSYLLMRPKFNVDICLWLNLT